MKRTSLWIALALVLLMGWAASAAAASLPQTTRPSGPKGKPTPTAVVAPTKTPVAESTETPVAEPTLAPTAEPPAEPTPISVEDGRDITSILAGLVQDAAPDDLITLNAETYVLDGVLIIDKPLTLQGAGADETIILSTHGVAAIRILSSATQVSFSGLTFQMQGEDAANVVEVEDAVADFADCRLTGGVWDPTVERSGDGLWLVGAADVSVDTCHFDDNERHGAYAQDNAALTVQNSVFTANGEDGILLIMDGTGDIRNNEFSANGYAGVSLRDAAQADIVDNIIADNTTAGIILFGAANASITGNEAHTNGQYGIALEEQSQAVIADNVANDNTLTGIVLFTAANATITGNVCSGNDQHGIALEGQSQGVVEDNTCRNNANDGIAFFGETGGLVRNNQCANNDVYGISVSDSSAPTLEDNICSGNGYAGLAFFDEAGGIARNNQVTANVVVGVSIGGGSSPLVQGNTVTRNGMHGVHVLDQAAPILEDNVIAENTEVGVYFADEATGAAIRTECRNNNWGIYIVDTANPWLEDNDCFDNVEADVDDRRTPEQAAAAVRPAPRPTPTGAPVETPTQAPSEEPAATPTPRPTATPRTTPTPAAAGDGRDATSALARLVQNTLPGGLITLRAGTYVLDGTLVIDKSLSIQGAGADETIILSTHGDAVVRVKSIFADVGFSGVTFQAQGDGFVNVVVVEDAAVDFTDCRFTGGVWDPEVGRGGDGLVLWGSAAVTVDNCRFDGNSLHGIETKEHSELTVINSIFTENGEDGIAFFGDTFGDVRDSEFFANGLHGIGSADAPELVLVGNNLYDNVEIGVRLAGQTQAEIRENTLGGNGLHGIALRGDVTGVIADNVTSGNKESGIALFGNANATITGNECNDNGLHGIGLEDQSQAVIEDNKCESNGEDGIVFFGEATGIVRNNEFTVNRLHGMGVSGSGSPTFEDNICSSNVETGIRLSESTAAIVRRNTCERNGLHGIHVRGTAAPLMEDNIVDDNEDGGIYFSDEATGAAIRTECSFNNWGIYIADTANPWLEDNNCHDNREADIDDRRSPEQAAAAVRPGPAPTTVAPTATPTAVVDGEDTTTPRPNGELLFSYDFDGGDQAPTPFFGTETMRYRETDGEGQLSSKTEGVVLPALFDLPPLADVYVEFDLSMPSPGPNSGYGLIFRVRQVDDIAGLDDYYLITFHPVAGRVDFARWEDDERWATQTNAPFPENVVVTDDYVRVRVEAVGGDFRVWLDDIFVAAFEDAGLLDAGDIGFSITPDPVGGREDRVFLDNLRIYAPVEAGVTPPVITPTPEPETPTGVLWSEDFENDATDFDLSVTDEGESWLEDGELHVLNYTDSPYAMWSYANHVYADAIIEVDSRFVGGSDDNWHQLLCRYVDVDNYIVAEYSADGYVYAKAVVDGEEVIALDVTASQDVRTGVDAINTMRLECVGDTIRYFLNDALLVEFTDTQLTDGDIVLGVSALDGDYSEVAYDNLVVTGPGVAEDETVGAPIPDVAPPAEEPTPAPAEAIATVTAQRLNVRAGPGANFSIVATARQGDELPVLGRNADCSWINVLTDAGEGWVSAGFVSLDADCTALPNTASQQTGAQQRGVFCFENPREEDCGTVAIFEDL